MRLRSRGGALWFALLFFALTAGSYFARVGILTRVGNSLIRADPLIRADAIVILTGETPLREIEAADLYNSGYARRVVMTLETEPVASELLLTRGVEVEGRNELRARIVRSLGVPASAVTVLDKAPANSTKFEAELVRDWASVNRVKRIIIVTSASHSTRASLIFRRVVGRIGIEVLTRPARNDRFRSDSWWRDRDQLRNAVFEWQKLLYYYVAYP